MKSFDAVGTPSSPMIPGINDACRSKAECAKVFKEKHGTRMFNFTRYLERLKAAAARLEGGDKLREK